MNTKITIALLMMAIAVAGCNSTSSALNVNTQTPPEPLPSVPSGTAQTAQLEPIATPAIQTPVPTPTLAAPTAPTAPLIPEVEAPKPLETASLSQSEPSNKPLTHEPLAGSWNVASDSAQCRAILAFTKWSGGFRATTLRCNSPELSTVTAWDVKGPRVVLFDNNGGQVASLASVGTERYSGTTASGKPITFSR